MTACNHVQKQCTAQNDNQAESLPVVSTVFPSGFKPRLSADLCNGHDDKHHSNGSDHGNYRVHACADCAVHPSAFEQKHSILSAFLDVATHPITMFTVGVFVGLVLAGSAFFGGF